MLSTVPRPGTVLVTSAGPPLLPGVRCVDVRLATAARGDGDRPARPLVLHDAGVHKRFGLRELSALEAVVAAALAHDGRGAVRFGDRATCRRVLPAPAVAAIERRLGRSTEVTGETLVTWTRGDPAGGAGDRYDVVLP